MVDVARHHLGPESDRGHDRRLGTGVVALDVRGRVTLGVAQLLGLGQRVGVAGASSDIRVRMKLVVPLTMPVTRRTCLARQRFAQRAQDRDAAGDSGLEEQVDLGMRSAASKSSAP